MKFLTRPLILLTALAVLSACNARHDQANDPLADLPPHPEALPEPSAESTAQAEEALPNDVQIYQDANGMFALAFPAGYQFEPQPQGVSFVSSDGGFGGEIRYFPNQPKVLSLDELDVKLKQAIESRLKEVNWQKPAREQLDGSLRLDWKGVDANGRALDGISFIEQHDSTLFILTANGINHAYSDYNDDARIIAGTYVVRQDRKTDAGTDEKQSSPGG